MDKKRYQEPNLEQRLNTCPRCGNAISNFYRECEKCGFPIHDLYKALKTEYDPELNELEEDRILLVVLLIMFCLIVLGIYIFSIWAVFNSVLDLSPSDKFFFIVYFTVICLAGTHLYIKKARCDLRETKEKIMRRKKVLEIWY